MKLKKTRNIVIAMGLAAVAVVPFNPVGASEAAMAAPVQTDIAQDSDGAHLAIAPCTAVGVTTGGGSTQTVVIEGTATATGAVATRIKCGIVQGGRVVASVQNALPGSVAATAGNKTIAVAPYTVCADVYALFADGAEVYDYRCP